MKIGFLGFLKIFKYSKNIKVFIPHFPTPEDQNYKSWEKILLQYKKFINNDTVFYCTQFWLSVYYRFFG